MFYSTVCERGKYAGNIKGFPPKVGEWCKKLKFEKVDIRRYILLEIQREQEGRKEGRKAARRSVWIPTEIQGTVVQFEAQSAKPRTDYTDSQCETGTGVQPTSSHPYGFPISIRQGQWCQRLKLFSDSPKNEGRKINIIQYIGIAADEPKRIAKHIGKPNIIMPLVEIGWEEDLCGLISGYQNLLSPVYTTATRDGCWFCHNQSVGQLRNLRKNYPDLWALLLKWDLDSPVSFKPDGRTVHDFDARFAMEDEGLISPDDPWKWGYLADTPLQLKLKF